MNRDKRRLLAREALDGYVSGPAATTEATAHALAKLGAASAVVLVEGISDQMAVEALAERRGRDLEAERIVVVPIGGAQAITRFLSELGPMGADLELAGLCDVGEEEVFRRGLARAGLGAPEMRVDMERLGFYVCVEDLEDELIRAVGVEAFIELLESQGDLVSFRSLQGQPAWRGRPVDAQLRRYLGAGARRKLRYARLLVQSVDLERVPRPLDGVLDTV